VKKLVIERLITTALTLALVLGMLPSVPFFVLAEEDAASPQEPPETEVTDWENIEGIGPGSPKPEKREPSENIEEEVYLTPLTTEEFEELIEGQPEEEIEDIEAYIERVYNEDGSVTECYFFEPIKYKDENEEWQYINPAIKEELTPDGEAIYVSDRSDVKIEFAGNDDETTAATIRKGEHTVTLQPVESENWPASGDKRTLFIDTGHNTLTVQEMVRGNALGVDTPGNLNTSKNSTTPTRGTKEDSLQGTKEGSLQEMREDSTFKEESYDAIKFEGALGESRGSLHRGTPTHR